MRSFVWEFFVFGLKQARSCVFAASFFGLLFLSRYLPLHGLPRYDFLCIAAVLLQVILVVTRIETLEEVFVLCAFHALGLTLELFKTHPTVAAWSYPEAAYLKLGTVPLYSGFMYAAVASYMCQAWRVLRLELVHYPSYKLSIPLCAAVYLNFFTNHFLPDARWILLVPAIVVVFWRTRVNFVVTDKRRSMPLLLSFVLIGFFVWIAENVTTFLGAYRYPQQRTGWQAVSLGIYTSWALMVIISFMIVAELKYMRERRKVYLQTPRAQTATPAVGSRVHFSGQSSVP
jgi:uncharacterized membrane protein YoaT (DUF817 family)